MRFTQCLGVATCWFAGGNRWRHVADLGQRGPELHDAHGSAPARKLLWMQYSRVLPRPGTRISGARCLPCPTRIQPLATMALAIAAASKPAQTSLRHAWGKT